MATKPGDQIFADFATQDPKTGAARNADSTPTGVLVRNGTDTAETVIVNNKQTGVYNAQSTIPTNWVLGDDVQIRINASVASVVANDIVWQESLDADLADGGAPLIYCNRSDIENIYGITNVEKWADLENDGSQVSQRIDLACVKATAHMNSRLKESKYAIPLQQLSQTIIEMAATWAGVWLYGNRGIVDFAATGEMDDQLQHKRNWFDLACRSVHAGTFDLGIPSEVEITYPFVVKGSNEDNNYDPSPWYWR